MGRELAPVARASRLWATGCNFQNLYPSSVASNQSGGQATLPATERRFTALGCDVNPLIGTGTKSRSGHWQILNNMPQ